MAHRFETRIHKLERNRTSQAAVARIVFAEDEHQIGALPDGSGPVLVFTGCPAGSVAPLPVARA